MTNESTKIKLIKKCDISLTEEVQIPLSIYKCMSCGWEFVGDATRENAFEYTQFPNFCPMCGKKISDFEETREGKPDE